MTEFHDEDEDLVIDPKLRHLNEVKSRRTVEQQTMLLREAFNNLREELNGE